MNLEFRVLTLWQPWASLIALGLKGYETRSWGTAYQGKLLIHAAKRKIDNDGIRVWLEAQKIAGIKPSEPSDPFFTYLNLPLGCIVSACDLTKTLQMVDTEKTGPVHLHPHLQISINSVSQLERAVGDWREDRYAWKLCNVINFPTPIPYKNGQGLRKLKDEAIAQQISQLIEGVTHAQTL